MGSGQSDRVDDKTGGWGGGTLQTAPSDLPCHHANPQPQVVMPTPHPPGGAGQR